jgi:hypothetical protein
LGGKTNIPIPIKKTKSERREHTQAETVGNFNRGAAAAAACIIVISEECFFFSFFPILERKLPPAGLFNVTHGRGSSNSKDPWNSF